MDTATRMTRVRAEAILKQQWRILPFLSRESTPDPRNREFLPESRDVQRAASTGNKYIVDVNR